MDKTIYRQSKVMGFDPKVINLVCFNLEKIENVRFLIKRKGKISQNLKIYECEKIRFCKYITKKHLFDQNANIFYLYLFNFKF